MHLIIKAPDTKAAKTDGGSDEIEGSKEESGEHKEKVSAAQRERNTPQQKSDDSATPTGRVRDGADPGGGGPGSGASAEKTPKHDVCDMVRRERMKKTRGKNFDAKDSTVRLGSAVSNISLYVRIG